LKQRKTRSLSISHLNGQEEKEEPLPIPNQCTLNDLTYDIKKRFVIIGKTISKISASSLSKMEK